jgi:hypothetical protein
MSLTEESQTAVAEIPRLMLVLGVDFFNFKLKFIFPDQPVVHWVVAAWSSDLCTCNFYW